MNQNLTEWQAAERIADQPEVHEALEAFSHDSTGDNGVEVVLAVAKEISPDALQRCADAVSLRLAAQYGFAAPAPAEALPWDDLKVAFGFTCDPDNVWDELSPDVLPSGWRLVETDGAGARYVAVFRVNGHVLPEDGRAVAALLRRLEEGETL